MRGRRGEEKKNRATGWGKGNGEGGGGFSWGNFPKINKKIKKI